MREASSRIINWILLTKENFPPHRRLLLKINQMMIILKSMGNIDFSMSKRLFNLYKIYSAAATALSKFGSKFNNFRYHMATGNFCQQDIITVLTLFSPDTPLNNKQNNTKVHESPSLIYQCTQTYLHHACVCGSSN